MATSARPVASVIVPVFNAARWIAATIASALAQTCRAIEVIAVDDGSTDETPARLAAFDDPRLVVITQVNRGAPAALNAGLARARGEFVGFLDHDDVWAPGKVARHLEIFDNSPHTEVTFSWYGLIDQNGRRIPFRTPRWRGPIGFRSLLEDYVVGSTSSLILRRSAIERAGGFDESFPRCHDTDLVLRISLGREDAVCAVPEELSLYRRHRGQMSGDWRAMRAEWNALLEKLRRIAPAETAAAERMARSNIHRYYACVAYENGEFSAALALLRESFRIYPRAFAGDRRNWRALAAAASGAWLPPSAHRALERAAGVRETTGDAVPGARATAEGR